MGYLRYLRFRTCMFGFFFVHSSYGKFVNNSNTHMLSLSIPEKLLLHSYSYHNSPISFTRIMRTIYLADLSHQITYHESFSLAWEATTSNGRIEPTSPLLKTSLYRLCFLKLLRRRSYTSHELYNPMQLPIKNTFSYCINAYLRSAYLLGHPNDFTIEENRLKEYLRLDGRPITCKY